ncbi:hypothetical protein D3C72_1416820 [compost metagenome]
MIHHVFDEIERGPAAHDVRTGCHHFECAHDAPLGVSEQQFEVFRDRCPRLYLKGIALFGGEETDIQQHHAAQPQHAHRAKIAQLFIAFTDDPNQRQSNAADSQRSRRRQEETPRLKGMALFRIGSDHPRHRAVRHVNEGVDQRQQDVGHAGVNDFAVGREIRGVKGEHTHDAKRDGSPQQEWAELPVTRPGAVDQKPH